ncbi:hypothetical protein D3C72_1463530 [compost metagenome]
MAGAMMPVALHLAGQRQDIVRQGMDRQHMPLVAPGTADVAGQGQHGADRPHRGRDAHQPSSGLPPPGSGRQDHAMEGNHQEDDGGNAVHLAPDVIGEAPPQRQQNHRQQDPHGPFADVLGRAAKYIEQGGCARRFDRRVEKDQQHRLTHLDEVVRRSQRRGQDAAPLVQQVHLVQPAEPALQPHRPHRQQHDQRHQRVRAQAGQQNELVARGPDVDFGRGLQPTGAGPGQKGNQENSGQNSSHRCIAPSETGACAAQAQLE